MCVLTLLPAGPGISEEINDSGLTCAQILKLGSEAFVDKYAPGGRGGSVKVRQGYYIYTDCRTKENQRLITRLPSSMRTPMKTISEQLRIAALASVEMREALAGGGTMYLDFRAAAVAETSSYIGNTLSKVRLGKRDASARYYANKNLESYQYLCDALAKLGRSCDSTEYKTRFFSGLKRYQSAYKTIAVLVRNVPDGTAVRFAENVRVAGEKVITSTRERNDAEK